MNATRIRLGRISLNRIKPVRSAAALGRGALILGALCTAGGALAGCSSGPAALPACHAPEAAVLPETVGSLTEADTGTYCLGIGKTLDVFLHAPASSASSNNPVRWGQISIGDTSVLTYGNTGVMTPPISVTPGVIIGASRGTTTVTSSLPNGRVWTATIVVS